MIRVDRLLRPSRSYVAGLLVGLPIAAPRPPFYWLAFLAFLLIVRDLRVPRATIALLAGLLTVSFVSSLTSPEIAQLSLFRVLYASFFYILLLFGFGVRERDLFLRGFATTVNALAALVIVAFIATGSYRYGQALFIMPVYRLWGASLFPDWPNFFAFLLGVGLLINLIYLRSKLGSALTAAAIVLTTSRTGVLGLLFAGAYVLARGWRRPIVRWTVMVGVVPVMLLAVRPVLQTASSARENPWVEQRLLKTSDRQAIMEFSAELIRERPVLGWGHVLLDESIGAPASSFHNAYFEVLIRHGVIAFACWLALLFPARIWRPGRREVLLFVAFFAISAAFNTIFKHPHLLAVYSVLLFAPVPSRENPQ